jgi:hypothetical protein
MNSSYSFEYPKYKVKVCYLTLVISTLNKWNNQFLVEYIADSRCNLSFGIQDWPMPLATSSQHALNNRCEITRSWKTNFGAVSIMVTNPANYSLIVPLALAFLNSNCYIRMSTAVLFIIAGIRLRDEAKKNGIFSRT